MDSTPPHAGTHADSGVATLVPAEVATRLQHTTPEMLVDSRAVQEVRHRFDDEHASALAGYLTSAQSPNTLRAYRTDWVAFAAWCQRQHSRPLPADPLDVAVYLAAAADTPSSQAPHRWALSPATLERKAAAIAAVHAAHGLTAPTRTDVVRMTLRGIRRRRRSPPQRTRPLLRETLEELLAGRPEPTHPGGVARRRDTLLLLAGFAGALRRSELVALTFDDVTVAGDPRTGEPFVVARLWATKTDQEARDSTQVALPRGRHRATCPVCALADWAEVVRAHRDGGTPTVRDLLDSAATDAPASGPTTHRCHTYGGTDPDGGTASPLFPAVSRHGHIAARAMTGRAVADLVKRYAQRAGLDPRAFSGHSLRAGFATQAALGGASDREIMRQGRWVNPRTVHGYIRTANPLDDNAVTHLGL